MPVHAWPMTSVYDTCTSLARYGAWTLIGTVATRIEFVTFQMTVPAVTLYLLFDWMA